MYIRKLLYFNSVPTLKYNILKSGARDAQATIWDGIVVDVNLFNLGGAMIFGWMSTRTQSPPYSVIYAQYKLLLILWSMHIIKE